MDRDVLLLLLVGAVLANVGLLALVGLLRARPWESPVAREASERERDPSSWAPVRAPRLDSAPPAAPVPAVAPSPSVAAAAADAATPAVVQGPSVDSPAPAFRGARPAAPSIARPAAPATARHPTHRATPRRPKRPQRFRMPDLDEDHERTAHSIAAFLGEPIAPTAGARPHRRRHRARRAAGTNARTDLILVLDGEAPVGRVTRAVAAALRDAVRESDAIVELPGGRLRVTLDTDAAGGQAFLERARGVVRPWLEVLGASMDVAPEPAAAEPATAGTHPASAAG